MLSIIIFTSICLCGVPFTHSIWDDGNVTWHRSTWSFGTWAQYDRIPENEYENFGGFYDLNDGYSVAIIFLFVIAIIFPLASVFFVGRNKRQSFTLQRVFASLLTIGAIAGILATIFFGLFFSKQTADPFMKLYIGFYVSAISFPCLLIMSVKTIIVSNQIPKPTITPAPHQEGQLFPEKKKDAIRRQLFHHIDDIKDDLKED